MTTYVLDPRRIAFHKVDGRIVALELDGATYLSVNPSGVPLWERLGQGPATTEELAALLAGTYDLAPEQAARDTAVFLEELMARDLLRKEDG